MGNNQYIVRNYDEPIFVGSHKDCLDYLSKNISKEDSLSHIIDIEENNGLITDDQKEEEALYRYNNGEKYSVSTFIDEDTIIAGYGQLDYDFEFPLPRKTIIEIYGTNSWNKYFELYGGE